MARTHTHTAALLVAKRPTHTAHPTKLDFPTGFGASFMCVFQGDWGQRGKADHIMPAAWVNSTSAVEL